MKKGITLLVSHSALPRVGIKKMTLLKGYMEEYMRRQKEKWMCES